MKTFFALYILPILGVIGVSLLIGVLLAIILNVLIFGENLEKDKNDD